MMIPTAIIETMKFGIHAATVGGSRPWRRSADFVEEIIARARAARCGG